LSFLASAEDLGALEVPAMAAQRSSKHEFIIAAVGDVHGHFRALVRLLVDWEKKSGLKIDLVLQVGDLEPHRHEADLETMSAPVKYRKLGDFREVFDGRTAFPWPVIFIGGNHEPYGALDEHPEGYELCPNIIYLGRSGLRHLEEVIRIVGLSGVAPPNEEVEEMSSEGPVHRGAAGAFEKKLRPGSVPRILRGPRRWREPTFYCFTSGLRACSPVRLAILRGACGVIERSSVVSKVGC
jgi:hypothetical protein